MDRSRGEYRRAPPAPAGDGVVDARITAVMLEIERRLTEPLDIHLLAAMAGLSRSRLMHLFRQRSGETVAGYASRTRLDHAARQLCWSDERIGAIAVACGYGSQAAFTHAFTARYGLSPARFRADDPERGHQAQTGLDGAVEISERPPLRCLAARYRGGCFEAGTRWADFVGRLPEGLRPAGDGVVRLYVSIPHDDPRIPPDGSASHTLCVVLPEDWPQEEAGGALALRRQGLAATTLPGGLFAGVRHRGPYRYIHDAYRLLYSQWRMQQSRYRLCGQPPNEVWRYPPLSLDDDVECELLAPVERMTTRIRKET